jgi:hypothetical protein
MELGEKPELIMLPFFQKIYMERHYSEHIRGTLKPSNVDYILQTVENVKFTI